MPKNEMGKAFIEYYIFLKNQRKVEEQAKYNRIKLDFLECTKNFTEDEKKCRDNIVKMLEELK